MSLGVNDDYNNKYNKLPSTACQVNSPSGGTQGVTANSQNNQSVFGSDDGSQTKQKGDNFTHNESTEVNNNRRSLTPERDAANAEVKKNNNYYSKLAGTINDSALRSVALAMTEAINNRDEAKAAVCYETLQNAGVFTKGVEKPPYADALEKRIQEQKNQKLAEDVVDDMNTDKGIKDIKNTYDSFGATRKEIREKLKSDEYGIQHGRRQIAKAIDKNRQHLSKQLALQEVIIDDGTDTSKSYKFKTQDGKTLEFTGSAKDAYKFVKEHSSEIYGKEWDKKAPPAAYMSEKGYATAQKLNDLAKKDGKSFIVDGKIDIEKAQAYAREKVSMAGDRGDQNELKALAGELNVKAKDVKAMLRGINIDYQKDRRWVGHVVGGVLGAGVAATDLATGFMGSSVGKTVETTITGGKIIETVVQPGVIKKETIKTGPDGKTQTFTEYVTTPGSKTSEEVPGTKSTKVTPNKRKVGVGDVIKDLALGYTVYDLTSKGLNKVLMHDPNILKKGHTLADALDNPDKNYLKKKSNNEVMSLISKAELKGYTPEETRAIKLQLLEKCMGDSGEKLNRRELFGVLATLKSIPPKAETSTPPGEQTPPPEEQTPPPFDPSKYGTNYKLGNGFWNDKLQNADGTFGGYVKNPDGSLVQEISGEKANEIGAFGRDNRLDERHKKDSYQVKVPEIGVEHDNWANENKRGKALWGYLHGLLYGNTVANIDESAMRDNALQALANPQSVVVTDPTYGNVWTLTRRDDGNYELTDLKDKDGASLKINKKHVYSLNSLQKKDKDTSNNVAAGFEYQFTNISGSANGDGRSASDKLTAQIDDDYKKNHQVKKGKRR